MRQRAILGLLMAALWLAGSATAATVSGKVVGITDGDTITILKDQTPVKVRLYGIDCPEKKQPYGTKAKQYTSDKCFGKVVTVKEHGKDRNKRTIGEVILPDNRSLNQLLVKDGMAWWFREYAPKDTTLEVLENEARKAKRGLWQDNAPVPPWEFRKQKKKP